MYDGSEVIGNVYLSSVVDSRSNTDIQSTRVGIVPGNVETFNMVFADMDTDDNTFVQSGAKFVINVPKEWTDVTILNNYGFLSSPTVTVFGDGSQTRSFCYVSDLIKISESIIHPTLSDS